MVPGTGPMRSAPLSGFFGCTLSRRAFVHGSLGALALLALPAPLTGSPRPQVQYGFIRPQPASFFRRLPGQRVQCELCPRRCEVLPGDRGECGVRENRQGQYYTLVYGNPCAVHVDPIEKKPFFHVLPGSSSFSIATAGCNLRCKFCQNWEISQARPEETYNFDLPPEAVVAAAQKSGSASIAHTYVEPVIFYEYMLAVGRLAKQAKVLNVCHSNGYINPEPLAALAEFLDAACIDLKSFDNRFYQELTDGDLPPVLQTLKLLKQKGIHIEIVNLVIPQYNDARDNIHRMCRWIAEELSPLTPLHFSRFYPMHKMAHHYPTPVGTLEMARETALAAGLKYVYIGNRPGHPGENSFCHACGQLIISRRGYLVSEVHLTAGRCRHCGAVIPGIWQSPS